MKKCKTCSFHDDEGKCTNSEKIHERDFHHPAQEIDDHFIYSYGESGYFWTGDEFGCVHWTHKGTSFLGNKFLQSSGEFGCVHWNGEEETTYKHQVDNYNKAKLAIQRELLILELAKLSRGTIADVLRMANESIDSDAGGRLIEELGLGRLGFTKKAI